MLKILSSPSKTVTGAAIVISAATLLSRIVGIARDRVFAHYFGAGQVMDAYYAAFKIPDLIYSLLIVGALTAGFIPTFTKLFYSNENKSIAWRLCNNIVNIMGVALIILCGLGFIFTPALAHIIAPGFSGDNFTLVIGFTRIMLLSPIFLGISMVMGGILQSLRHFLLYSIAPVFYNLGIIIGAVFLQNFFGVMGLAWGVVLGAFMHSAIQIYGARLNGYRWKWHFNLRERDTVTIWKLMIPRTLGISISQLNTVVVTMLASLLPVGSVAVYNYANNLQAVPTGIIGIPFALAVFPILSSLSASAKKSEYTNHLADASRQIIFLIIPLTVIFLLLRAQIVRVILGSGEFDWTATIATADTLAFFAFGLLAQSLIPLFARAFYSLSNTKTPFIIGVISEVISIVVAVLLMKTYGVAGLALASSLGATINMLLLFIFLRRSTEDFFSQIFPTLYKTTAAALFMAIIVQIIKYPLGNFFDQTHFWGIFGQGAVAGVVGLAVYAFSCYILKLPELLNFVSAFQRRWLRFRGLPLKEGIDIKE